MTPGQPLDPGVRALPKNMKIKPERLGSVKFFYLWTCCVTSHTLFTSLLDLIKIISLPSLHEERDHVPSASPKKAVHTGDLARHWPPTLKRPPWHEHTAAQTPSFLLVQSTGMTNWREACSVHYKVCLHALCLNRAERDDRAAVGSIGKDQPDYGVIGNPSHSRLSML